MTDATATVLFNSGRLLATLWDVADKLREDDDEAIIAYCDDIAHDQADVWRFISRLLLLSSVLDGKAQWYDDPDLTTIARAGFSDMGVTSDRVRRAAESISVRLV